MDSAFINDLLLSVLDIFQELYESSHSISELEKRLNAGKASLTDAENYAEEIGRLLNRAYSKVLGAADLPEGNVYWETCKALIEKPLTEAYNKVAEATVKALDAENTKNGIGLKAQAGKLDADKLQGIADVANKAESFEKAAAAIAEPVHSVTRSAVVDTVHATADMQDAAGLEVKIVRTTRGSNPCSWCKAMAGTYDYASVKKTGHNVWRRHERCTCKIEYVSKKTRHSVDNYRSAADAARAKVAERKRLGAGSDSTPEKIAARKALAGVDALAKEREFIGNAQKEDINKHKELHVTATKTKNVEHDIWQQKGLTNAKALAKKVDRAITEAKKSYPDLSIPTTVLVNSKTLAGKIGGYDPISGNIFLNVDVLDAIHSDYHAANNLSEAIIHEVGHQEHWNAVKIFYKRNKSKYNSLVEAKEALEDNARAKMYKMTYDDMKSCLSLYACEKIALNEPFAEWFLRYKRDGSCSDEELDALMKGVFGLC